jgi:hypothetical protein
MPTIIYYRYPSSWQYTHGIPALVNSQLHHHLHAPITLLSSPPITHISSPIQLSSLNSRINSPLRHHRVLPNPHPPAHDPGPPSPASEQRRGTCSTIGSHVENVQCGVGGHREMWRGSSPTRLVRFYSVKWFSHDPGRFGEVTSHHVVRLSYDSRKRSNTTGTE